jgi:hypothetical protein
MDLQSDEAFRSHVVDQVDTFNSINESSDPIPIGLGPEFVPLSFLEGFPGTWVSFKRIQPAPSCFIQNTAAPGPVGAVAFDLIPMDLTIFVICSA